MGSGLSRSETINRPRFSFLRLLCGSSHSDDENLQMQTNDAYTPSSTETGNSAISVLNLPRSTSETSHVASPERSHVEPNDRISDFPLGIFSERNSSSPVRIVHASRPSRNLDSVTHWVRRSWLDLDSPRSSVETIVHVDVVTVSSSAISGSSGRSRNLDARNGGRRLIWGLIAQPSLETDTAQSSPSGFLSTIDVDDSASYDRWLHDMGVSSEESSTRNVTDLEGQQSDLCSSGLHQSGTCSCETLMVNEGLDTRASISRIILLAEALFEVLDEIHRHQSPFSFSTRSNPAPASTVNSFPLKSYKKFQETETSDAPQCYICLDEYEDDDGIRVLPCQHEYHKSCIDKWLTEVHGVCPLCRRDVCTD